MKILIEGFLMGYSVRQERDLDVQSLIHEELAPGRWNAVTESA